MSFYCEHMETNVNKMFCEDFCIVDKDCENKEKEGEE